MSDTETNVDKKGAGFRNRIKELRNVSAKELLSNPKNWRVHPEEQELALNAIMNTIGFCDALMARETEDGELILIDGHLRKDLAADAEVPVLVVDLTEKEADFILATHDGITGMAETDEEKLDALLLECAKDGEYNQSIAEVIYEDNFDHFKAFSDLEESIDEAAEEEASKGLSSVDISPEELRDRIVSDDDLEEEEKKLIHIWERIWETDLPYGIPLIEIDKCPPLRPKEIGTFLGFNDDMDYLEDEEAWWMLLYGREPKSKQALLPVERTILAFYVDDWRFEGMWTNPVPSLARLKNFGLQYAITPNFSLYADYPMAVQLFNVYRSRWVGRAMQEAGIQVIPDIQWSDESSYEYCFLGIPKGCPCVSIQFHTRGGEEESDSRRTGLAEMMRVVEPQGLIVYGSDSEEAETIRNDYNIPVTCVSSRWGQFEK